MSQSNLILHPSDMSPGTGDPQLPERQPASQRETDNTGEWKGHHPQLGRTGHVYKRISYFLLPLSAHQGI